MEADLVDHMKSIGQTTNARMTTACREYTDAEEAISDQYRRNPMAEETSNKAKIEKEIDVLETMNIELQHSVATLRKENETLKQHYKDLNSSKNMPRFSSNDMVHNHYLDKARKKTQERDRNSKTSVMPSARFQSTADGSKPKPREQQSTSRKFAMYLRDSRYDKGCVPPKQSTLRVLFFSPNSKQFVVLHVPSNKTTNRNKPVEQIRIAKKPERQIPTGHRFSIKKTSAVHEKTMTLRSCLRWKPTGKIFRTVGLRWVPTGKIFTPSTTKVEHEPQDGSNADISTNMEVRKLFDVIAGLNPQCQMTFEQNGSSLAPQCQQKFIKQLRHIDLRKRGTERGLSQKTEIEAIVETLKISQFLRELRCEDTFRKKNDDAYKHDGERAKRWVDRRPPGTVNSWDLLKMSFIQRYYPPSRTAKQLEEIPNFKQEGDETLYQAWEWGLEPQLLDSQGPIPDMTPVQALTTIQTMPDQSQKWHDGSSSRNIESSSNSEGIAAIVNKLENLSRDMKKLKENVHAIQVGCQNYRGAHLDKDFPLREEENAEINTRNQAASLLYLETQIEQLTKEFYTKAANEINNPSLDQCKAMYANKKTPVNNRQHEISVALNKYTQIVQTNNVTSKVLPCQLPPKELNPGNFTLPCTIGSLNFYAMADLGASVNVIPNSIFEHLELAQLNKTDMLVEMADMTKGSPVGIVENVLVKIDKFLFSSEFVV
ncbi:reverse transcriptase domain-containing protein [Tanacetum coccineum]